MKTIKKISVRKNVLATRKRVAAYARVSAESERLAHSLSAQISYYSELIQQNPEWEFAGVYADRFISGTRMERRAEFQRMIQDCEAGKIDIILTKSISRFARNTVDLLNTVRHLKELGIDVQFEKERIRSLSGDGELMLTLLASFAQEESRSISENVKWGIQKMYRQGIPHSRYRVYGYKWKDDVLVPVPEEASVVKRIFQNFLDGKSRLETERELNAEGITTRGGFPWEDSNIRGILKNITYTGNLLFQKEFVEDPITGKRRKNKGQLLQYLVEETHEAIIDLKTFHYVQDEMARRKKLGALANKSLNLSCFTSKIKCLKCGKNFSRHTRNNHAKYSSSYGDKYILWQCSSQHEHGGLCNAKVIPEKILQKCLAEVLGIDKFDETIITNRVQRIDVPDKGILIFHFYDGTEKTTTWKSTAPQDLWTEEFKNKFSKIVRNYKTTFTGKIKCGLCGGSVIREKSRENVFWNCSHRCRLRGIYEDELKEISSRIMGIQLFDSEEFKKRIQGITIIRNGELLFTLTDGSQQSAEYSTKRRVKPLSEERKKNMSLKMKELWAKRKMQENN